MPGVPCAYRPCLTRSGDGKALFKFPSEYERAKLWAEACNRSDILGKGKAIGFYKLCELHFDQKCFSESTSKRKRLHVDAIPTLFIVNAPRALEVNLEEEETPRKIRIIEEEEAPKAIKIISSIVIKPASENENQTCQTPLARDTSISAMVSNVSSPSYFQGPSTSKDVTVEPLRISPPLISPTVGTQTQSSLSSRTPRKIKLRSRIKHLQKRTIKEQQTFSKEDFYVMCDQYLDNPLAEVIKTHVKMKSRKQKARRYSTKIKQFSLALYFLSPKAYRYLAKMLTLPDKRTLERLTAKVSCQPGVDNKAIYQALEIKAKSMTENDKNCMLCIDEMSIKSNFFFEINSDKIIGYEDLGDGERRPEPCKNVLVVMARGLYSPWKQPIAFFFVGGQLPAIKLRSLLDKCIFNLEKIEFKVQGISSDMGSNFIQLSNILGVTYDNTEFELGGKKLLYFFDPCHLIKATRNNFKEHSFCFEDKKTSWVHVETFYNFDKSQFYRCAPKLTYAHLNPTSFEKMKVSYAAQVLSHSVACGMNTHMSYGGLPTEAFPTIEVIEKFNCLFDILNSLAPQNPYKMKNAFDGSDFQIKFLIDILDFLKNLRVVNKNNIDITKKLKFIKSWTITIKSLLKLWEILKTMGFKYLKTRRLNTDCLENYFGSVRQQSGNSVNPTPIQFQRAFKKLFVQNYFHSENMNCRPDLDNILLNLESSDWTELGGTLQPENPSVSVGDHSYRNENIPQQNAFNYVCGYLIKRCLQVHSCDTCEAVSKECKSLDINNILLHYKAFDPTKGNFGGLSSPPETFVNFIYNLDLIFNKEFEKISTGYQISNRLLNLFKNIEFDHPCGDFPKLFLLKLFIRCKIFYTLKFRNRDLKFNKVKKNVRKLKNLLHV